MTHAAETGAVKLDSLFWRRFSAPIFHAICVWDENFWCRKYTHQGDFVFCPVLCIALDRQ